MTRGLLTFVGLTISIAAGSVQAQAGSSVGATVESNARPVTLSDVLASVNCDHPLNAAASSKVRAAGNRAFAREGGFDPVVDVRGSWVPEGYYERHTLDAELRQATPVWGTELFTGWRLGQGDFPVYDGKQVTLDSGELRGGIRVPLLQDGAIDRRRFELRQARVAVTAERHAYTNTLVSLHRDAARAYWTWVEAGYRRDIAEALYAVAEQRDTALAERVARGDLAPVDRLDNQRAVLQRKARLIDAERALEVAANQLSLFWRNDEGAPLHPTPSMLPHDARVPHAPSRLELERDIERVLERRPDVQRLRAQRDAALLRLRYAANRVLPRLDTELAASRDLGTGPEQLRPTELAGTLSFRIPLLVREARGEQAAARAELAQIDAELNFLRDQVQVQLMTNFTNLNASFERYRIVDQEAQIARALEEAEREKLTLGQSNLIFVNLRELASADARQDHVSALAEYHRAFADYQAAKGELLMQLRAEQCSYASVH